MFQDAAEQRHSSTPGKQAGLGEGRELGTLGSREVWEEGGSFPPAPSEKDGK